MSIGVVVTKILTFFYNCVHVGLDIAAMCSGNGLVGGTVDSRHIPAGGLHTGPLQ